MSSSLTVPGSWTIEEESVAPQDSGNPDSEGWTPSTGEPQKTKTIHSEIVTLDPAKLAEEIVVIIPSTEGSLRTTRRIIIYPEYDIEVLQEDGSDIPHIRDSPQQRRSRCLDSIYPEFKDDLHSVSHSVADDPLMYTADDLEWDFSHNDDLLDLSFATSSGGNIGPNESRKDPVSLQGSPHSITDESGSASPDLESPVHNPPLPSHLEEAYDRESGESESALRSSSASLTTSRHTEDPSSLDAQCGMGHSSGPSYSAPATGIPSTLPLSPSLTSTLQSDGNDTISFGDSEGSEFRVPGETTGDNYLLVTPSSLAASSVIGVHPDSDSVISMLLRPAAESIASADDDHADRTELEGQEDPDAEELENLNEDPPLTSFVLLALDDISLHLSLDHSPDAHDWIYIHLPSSRRSSMDPRASTSSDVASEAVPPTTGYIIADDDDDMNEAIAEPAPLTESFHSSASSSNDGEAVPDDDDHIPEATPELPALHFQSPSLTDELLSSPEFQAVAFAPDSSGHSFVLYATGLGDSSRPSGRSRTTSAPHIERRSILWAPQESRYLQDDARAGGGSLKGKGKGKHPRTRTISDDSGFADIVSAVVAEPRAPQRVEREVQTEMNGLRAKVRRREKEVAKEKRRAKAAVRLSRDQDSGDAKLSFLEKVFSWGQSPSNPEDAIP
ncbi:hypothetical protein B0H10DRAFT_2033426 [Mycena sp. CBHHK59/15]|nr:hypothetical protein B0H10DRAFT_2033426 [Mycena sp. CBHHK59/15]